MNGQGGALTKTGVGTLILSGSNTYANGTTISAGTLRANNTAGSGTGSGSISVAATASGNYTGGKLGGNGTVSGTVTLAAGSAVKLGGIIAAGPDATTVGTLSTGNETWSRGSAYQLKLKTGGSFGSGVASGNLTGISGTAGTDYDTLKIGTASTGSLLTIDTTTGGSTAFTLDPIGTITGLTGGNTYNWVIAQIGTGTSTQITVNGVAKSASSTKLNPDSSIFALDTSALSINGNNQFSSPSNFSLYFETISGNNDLVLSYNAAPEPGTAMLVLGGALPMLMGRRRRRKVFER